jgi:hypothetical protein
LQEWAPRCSCLISSLYDAPTATSCRADKHEEIVDAIKRNVPDRSQGIQLASIQDLVRYWGMDYDWRRLETRLNALPQFMMSSSLRCRASASPANRRRPEWNPDRIGRAWGVLMSRLGYRRYVAQGGDWGAPVPGAMARQRVPGLLGIHVNLPSTVPAEIGAALASESAPPDLSSKESAAFVSLDTSTSSARLYWETAGQSVVLAAPQRTTEITLPVAITVFPGEVYQAPETWARRAYPNLTYFHEVDKGGHFAAWQVPELFAAELRAAFRPLRPLSD